MSCAPWKYGIGENVDDNLLTIAFASDARYMCLTAAAAWTALKTLSAGPGRVCVLLMASDVSENAIRAFERAIRSARADVEFRLINSHPPEVREMAARTGAPEAQFLRLYAADCAGPDARRVIYLDSDILVKDDLWKLHRINLEGKVAGAVIDFNYPTLRRRRQSLSPAMTSLDCWQRLSEEGPYFNSGVLLIDVRQWRDRGMKSVVVNHILQNAAALPIRDQDALVQCLVNQWHPLPLRWNTQTIGRFHMPQLSAWDKRETHGVAPEEVPDPGILHYNGSKPLRWGVSPRGRTRNDELSLCSALYACGYHSGLRAAAQQLHLHLRGTARSVWLECRQLGQSTRSYLVPQPARPARLIIPQPRLSLAPSKGGLR